MENSVGELRSSERKTLEKEYLHKRQRIKLFKWILKYPYSRNFSLMSLLRWAHPFTRQWRKDFLHLLSTVFKYYLGFNSFRMMKSFCIFIRQKLNPLRSWLFTSSKMRTFFCQPSQLKEWLWRLLLELPRPQRN